MKAYVMKGKMTIMFTLNLRQIDFPAGIWWQLCFLSKQPLPGPHLKMSTTSIIHYWINCWIFRSGDNDTGDYRTILDETFTALPMSVLSSTPWMDKSSASLLQMRKNYTLPRSIQALFQPWKLSLAAGGIVLLPMRSGASSPQFVSADYTNSNDEPIRSNARRREVFVKAQISSSNGISKCDPYTMMMIWLEHFKK